MHQRQLPYSANQPTSVPFPLNPLDPHNNMVGTRDGCRYWLVLATREILFGGNGKKDVCSCCCCRRRLVAPSDDTNTTPFRPLKIKGLTAESRDLDGKRWQRDDFTRNVPLINRALIVLCPHPGMRCKMSGWGSICSYSSLLLTKYARHVWWM